MVKDVDYFEYLSVEEQAELLAGEEQYRIMAEGNTRVIPIEELTPLNTSIIQAMFRYIFTDDDLDLEKSVAFENVQNVFSILHERNPLPPRDKKVAEEQRKEFMKYLREAVGNATRH